MEDEINCLVDSSPPEEEWQYVADHPINLIINSHRHSGHCSRNYACPDAVVLMHPAEHNRVSNGEIYLRDYGFDLFPDDSVRPLYLAAVKYAPRPADGEIRDGQTVSTGRVSFQVIRLPGHSAGHCGFLFPEQGFIFTADINPGSKPFFAMLDSDVDDFINSIEKLRSIGSELLITGHGPAFTKGNIPKRLAAYRDILFEQEEKILSLLKSGSRTIRDLAKEAVRYDGRLPQPQSVYYIHECMMDWKHLQRLERLRKVVHEGDNYYLAPGQRSVLQTLG
ncbi:MAG: MBL fold metallo-hydrolase [Syntrophomonadaceae bacterium]|nr:MBL fold metallo-hydrolase [Syntrophomonadaceae bacterium]